MADEPNAERLKALEGRIAAMKRTQRGQNDPEAAGKVSYSGAEAAWRMVTELLAGLLIGFGIGYGLDTVFGTMPIFLILFIFAGFAAGIRVMLGTAKSVQQTTMKAPGDGSGDEGN